MHALNSDLCAALATLGLGHNSPPSCYPPWHGEPEHEFMRSHNRTHKLYVVLGGEGITGAQLGIYTRWSTVEPIVKVGDGRWRQGIRFNANHGLPWTYAAAVAYWQQECGQGRLGHRCADAAPPPPRYTTTPPPNNSQQGSPRTPQPTTSSTSRASSTPASDPIQYIVIDGHYEIYTDERKVEAEVQRLYALGERPKITRHDDLSSALHAIPSPARRR